MKNLILAALLLSTPVLAQPAPAPGVPAPASPNTPKNWATIVMTANVARNADDAWKRIGGNDYCAITAIWA